MIALGSRERQCCHFARSGTNTLLRRFDRVKKFRSSPASSVKSRRAVGKPYALSTRSAQGIPVRENRRHTELRVNETLRRGGGKPPHASRSSGYASNSRLRHREGSSSGKVGFCNLARAEAAAFAAARYRAMHVFSMMQRLKSSREATGVHVAAQQPSQADKDRRALARRRSRLRAAPNCTASWRLHVAPSEASVSRGSHHSALRPAW